MRTAITFTLGVLHLLAIYVALPLGIAAIVWGLALRRRQAGVELGKDVITPQQEGRNTIILGVILILIGAFFAYRHFALS